MTSNKLKQMPENIGNVTGIINYSMDVSQVTLILLIGPANIYHWTLQRYAVCCTKLITCVWMLMYTLKYCSNVFAVVGDPEKSRRVCQCDPCKMKKQKLKSKEPMNRLKRRAM